MFRACYKPSFMTALFSSDPKQQWTEVVNELIKTAHLSFGLRTSRNLYHPGLLGCHRQTSCSRRSR